MSRYTTQVRFICESKAGYLESQGYDKVNEIISAARTAIFDFDYPLFDPDYKEHFETMILRHFYTREIGYETYGLWHLKFWDKICMIMPYYNKMYESALLQFNPLYDVDLETTHSGDATGTTADSENISNSKTTSDSNTRWDLFSDTPQGGIDVITNDHDGVADNTYLTDARKITDNGSGSETGAIARQKAGNMSSTDRFIDKVVGKRGGMTYSNMIKEFRQTFLKIDEMVCEELEPLFFGLW